MSKRSSCVQIGTKRIGHLRKKSHADYNGNVRIVRDRYRYNYCNIFLGKPEILRKKKKKKLTY